MEARRKKPTIKDIAREAGVSATTVINALAGRDAEMAATTAERVRAKARELGYVRNLTAAALTGKGSRAFALIITKAYQPVTEAHEADINPYYGEFILRLEHEARRAGFSFSLFGGDEDDYVHFVLERNLDAAVLLGIHKPDLPRALVQRGVPVILVDSAVHDPQSASVKTDDRRAGELAARHLLDRGCRRIGFLGDVHQPPDAAPSLRRLGAYLTCLDAGIPFTDIHRIASVEEGFAAAAEIKALGIDGVVAAADNLAAGLSTGLAGLGVRVPDEVAVVGYDNLLIARLATPPLTTIDQGMGEKVRIIVSMIERGQVGAIHQIQPRLVVRASA